MDRRTDNKRRPDTVVPSPDGKIAGLAAPKPRSFIDSLRRRSRLVFVTAAVLIVALVGVVAWQITSSGYVSTDDAFIDARTVPISSQVNVAIVEVQVTDNQLVGAGTVLVRLTH